jgi:hypothetical protein
MLPSDDAPAPSEPSTTADRSVGEQLAAIRPLRESLGPHVFDPDDIDAFKREGRP